MKLTWQLKEIPDPTAIQKLQQELQLDPILATLLVQRGIDTYDKARCFFRPDLTELHNPFLMKNMQQAVERFNQAVANNEKIVIYGDYDVDGTTSVSLFLKAIKKYYTNIDFYIPDRFSEGYGLNKNAVTKFHQDGVTLFFTLDCGIKSVSEVAYAKELGIDVIICDHHEPGEVVPDCWVLNPKQIDCAYPYKELSGCGVTFKFLQALFETNNFNPAELFDNLDLLALSIGADIVPISGENRILCAGGMAQINRQESTVIDLMFKHAKRSYPVTLTDIVFSITPRINAAGRIQHASQIVKMFTTNDLYEIEQWIQTIGEQNAERRSLDKNITAEALQACVEDEKQQFSNVVYNENWSKGVIGIVASKLVESNHLPSIVLTKSNGKLTGSGRSIPEVNLYDVLTKCEQHLEQFGGHAFACGLTLNEDQLPDFKACFDHELAQIFAQKNCTPKLEIDLEIDFDNIYTTTDITHDKLPKFMRILEQMQPFGPANMRPVFMSKNVFVSDFRILKDEHVKFEFQQHGLPIRLEGIAFNFYEKFKALEEAKPVDIVYSLGVNRWNGKETVQLEIRDMRNS